MWLFQVIADEKENIQQVATDFETDTQTIELCLSEAGTTVGKCYTHKHTIWYVYVSAHTCV